jgi:hypothetical protein
LQNARELAANDVASPRWREPLRSEDRSPATGTAFPVEHIRDRGQRSRGAKALAASPPLSFQSRTRRALSKIGEAFVSCRRPLFSNLSRQQPRRPQFVRIAEILGLAAGKIDNESPRFFGDEPHRPRRFLSSIKAEIHSRFNPSS